MKKFLKVVGIILGVIVLLIAAVLIFFNVKGGPTYEVEAPDMSIQADSAMLARGEYIVSLNCAKCHGEQNMSGQFMEDAGPWGKVYSPNITQHQEFGIGNYSEGELAFLLRTGIMRDGKLVIPIMPKFNHLGDDDLKAVIAYLKSDNKLVAPSDEQQPSIKPTLLGKVLMNLAVKPIPYPTESISAPPTSEQVAHGKYMSTALIHCYHCHSAGYEVVDDIDPENSEGYLGGGTLVENLQNHGEKVVASNITPHPDHGIGNWTADQFANAVRYGQGADGQPLSHAMPRFTNMTEEDAKAIFAYFQTIPPLENDVKAIIAASGE